jgi:nicotinamidase-related amidase
VDLIVGRAALLIIDMQHDFLDEDAPLPAVGGLDIVPAVVRVAEAARKAHVPVIYTQEAHRPGRVDSGREADPGMGMAWYPGASSELPLPEHCLEGSRGMEIIAELKPLRGDLTIPKRRFSCFLGTDLDLLLRGFRVDTLFVTGIDSNVCVLWTVGEAFQRDYHVRVLEDCVAGSSLKEHEAAVLIMRELTMGGRPVLSSEVIEALMIAEPAA